MTLGLVFLMSLVSVASFLVIMTRIIGWRKVLKHATTIDIIFTVMTCFVLAGSITGMVIAILAGLILTGVLTVGKALLRATDAAQDMVARRAKPVGPTCIYDDGWEPVEGWDGKRGAAQPR